MASLSDFLLRMCYAAAYRLFFGSYAFRSTSSLEKESSSVGFFLIHEPGSACFPRAMSVYLASMTRLETGLTGIALLKRIS